MARSLAGFDALVYAVGPDDRTRHEGPAGEFYAQALVATTARVVAAARAAGVRRVVILGSYFATWVRMRPDLPLAQRHPYIQARLDQTRQAIAAGGSETAVMVLEIPYVFGVRPGTVPTWKHTLFDVVRRGPLVVFPGGGTSVVTSRHVAEAAVAALERGRPGACYPLADEQWSFRHLLGLIHEALGTRAVVASPPPAVLDRVLPLVAERWGMGGGEAGLDPSHIAGDLLGQRIFVDPRETVADLGWRAGAVPEALVETLRASYPGWTVRPVGQTNATGR
ncbi:NAD(P)H-binding protein [Actinomycetota bacterium]